MCSQFLFKCAYRYSRSLCDGFLACKCACGVECGKRAGHINECLKSVGLGVCGLIGRGCLFHHTLYITMNACKRCKCGCGQAPRFFAGPPRKENDDNDDRNNKKCVAQMARHIVQHGGVFFGDVKQKMSGSTPQSTYKKGVVLYHWRKCPHSARFMPRWSSEIRPQLLEQGLNVWEIEVEDHKATLEHLGVSLGEGVPRIMFFNDEGVGVAHIGDRSARSILSACSTHIGSMSGGGGGGDNAGGDNAGSDNAGGDNADLPSVTPSFVTDNLPATVLYFRHSCGYCVRFLPTFTEFSHGSDVGTVVSVDTSVHPEAMGALHPDARSPGVPHVVYHASDGTQTPFRGDRTLSALRKFVKSMSSARRSVSFEGGSTLPVTGSADVRLTVALDKLQQSAAETLGKRYRRVFEPENSSVSFVGSRTRDSVNADRVYILLSPHRQPRGKPTAHACVYGSRRGELTTKIYVNKDTDALLRNKRGAGFSLVRDTDPYVAALDTFGYHVDLS